MHTRCPHCDTCFRVTPEHLELAQGAVRCGRCFGTFNARDHLIESPEEEEKLNQEDAAAEEAGTHQAELKSAPETTEETPATETSEIAEEKQKEDNTETPPSPTPASERSFDVVEEIESRSAVEKRRGVFRTMAGLLVIATLTLGLVGQYLYAKRASLAQDLETRPLVEMLCSVTGCEVPLIRKPHHIKLVDRDIRSHPEHDNALLVEAEMVNEAPYIQAYPILKLTLHDITGKILSGRSFSPDEYLPKHLDQDQGMASRKNLKVILVLVDPGEEAVGFEFEFH